MRSLKIQKGYLLISALVLVITVGFLVVTVARMTTTTASLVSQEANSSQAFFDAQAGLEYGRFQYFSLFSSINPTAFCDGAWKETKTLGSGEFRYKCTYYTPTSTTLSVDISNTNLIIPVANLSNYAPLGRVVIGTELIDYTGTSSSSSICGTETCGTSACPAPCLIANKRGADLSYAVSHTTGNLVLQSQAVLESQGVIPSILASNIKAKRTLLNAVYYDSNPLTGWAVGFSGEMLKRTPAGWSEYPITGDIPGFNKKLNGISCGSKRLCYAVGVSSTVIVWTGFEWVNVGPLGQGSIDSVVAYDAPGEKFFLTGGGNVYQCTGATCSPTPVYIKNGVILSSIACGSSTDCIVVGTSGFSAHWTSPSTWTEIATPQSVHNIAIMSVSCPNTSNCWAVGEKGTILYYDGSSWSSVNVSGVPANRSLNSISCSDINNCWVVGDNGNYFVRKNGSTWTYSAQSGLPSDKNFAGISCLSASECAAVGEKSPFVSLLLGEYNGSSWYLSTVPGAASQNLVAVSIFGQGTATNVQNIVWKESFT